MYVESVCSECNVISRHRVVSMTQDRIVMEGLSSDDTAFSCEHWKEAQEVEFRALHNKSGRAWSWPIKAKVVI